MLISPWITEHTPKPKTSSPRFKVIITGFRRPFYCYAGSKEMARIKAEKEISRRPIKKGGTVKRIKSISEFY